MLQQFERFIVFLINSVVTVVCNLVCSILADIILTSITPRDEIKSFVVYWIVYRAFAAGWLWMWVGVGGKKSAGDGWLRFAGEMAGRGRGMGVYILDPGACFVAVNLTIMVRWNWMAIISRNSTLNLVYCGKQRGFCPNALLEHGLWAAMQEITPQETVVSYKLFYWQLELSVAYFALPLGNASICIERIQLVLA